MFNVKGSIVYDPLGSWYSLVIGPQVVRVFPIENLFKEIGGYGNVFLVLLYLRLFPINSHPIPRRKSSLFYSSN